MEEQVDLSRLRSLYRKIVNVEEYYHPEKKWTNLLPDGKDVRTPDLYYSEEGLIGVVQTCINAGAILIQFKCVSNDMSHKDYCYPDFKVRELLKQK